MAPSVCPGLDQLRLLSQYQLEGEELERLAQHLEHCPKCSSYFDNTRTDQRSAADTGDGEAKSDTADDLSTPKTIGAFRVLKKLGGGGMGDVFFAWDPVVKRYCVIKTIKPDRADKSDYSVRFFREIQAQAAVADKSDYIMPVLSADTDKATGTPYMAMPYFAGETLEERFAQSGVMPVEEILRIAREFLLGIAAAHKAGMIHRDIKPSNIYLEEREDAPSTPRVRIIDFGLVKPLAADAVAALQNTLGITREGMAVGTPGYMAPEQISGDEVDVRADLFAFGCTLYRLATGKLPFGGSDVKKWMSAVLGQNPPTPPMQVNAKVPKGASDLILSLLEKDAVKRPASADEVLKELLKLQEAAIVGPAAPKLLSQTMSYVDAASATRKRRSLAFAITIALTACAALVALSVGAFFWNAQPYGGDGNKDVATKEKPPRDKLPEQKNFDLSLMKTLELSGSIFDLAFTSDGKSLWTGIGNGTMTRWDIDKGETRETIREVREQFALTPDGRYALCWTINNPSPLQWVRLANPKSGEITKGPEINTAALSRDGRRAVAVSAGGVLLVFDIDDDVLSKEKKVATKLGGIVRRIAIHPKKIDQVLLALDTGHVILFDLKQEKELDRFGPGNRSNCYFHTLAFSSSGDRFLVSEARQDHFLLYQIGQQVAKKFTGHGAEVWAAFSHDDRWIVSTGWDKTLRVWDPKDATEVLARKMDGKGHRLAVSPAGDLIAVGTGETAQVWRLSGTEKGPPPSPIEPKPEVAEVPVGEIRRFEGHTAEIRYLAFSRDGDRLLTGSVDKTVRLWEVATGKELFCFKKHKAQISSVAFSLDGSHALSGDYDGTVVEWNLTNGAEKRRIKTEGNALSMAFSADQKHVLVGHFHDRTIRLWDLKTEQEKSRAKLGFGPRNVAFLADGRRAITGDGFQILICDLETEKPVPVFETLGGNISSVAVSPDGRRVLCGAMKNLFLLDSEHDPKSKAKLKYEVLGRRNAGSWVMSVAFTPDGRRALSTDSWDSTLTLWDVESLEKVEDGKPLWRFKGHTREITAMATTPDGRHAVSGSANGEVVLWRLPADAKVSARPLDALFVKHGKDVVVFKHPDELTQLAVSPSGKMAATACANNSVRLWDLATGESREWPKGAWKPAVKGAWKPALSQLVFLSEKELLVCVESHPTIHNGVVWNVDDNSCEPRPYADKDFNERGPLRYLNISRQGKGIVMASRYRHPHQRVSLEWPDGSFKAFLLHDGQPLLLGRGGASLSADGKRVLASIAWAGDDPWNVWDTDNPATPLFKKSFLRRDGRSMIRYGIISPDGKRAAFVRDDGPTILFWDLTKDEDSALLGKLEGHGGSLKAMAFSPTGDRLLSGATDGKVILWDLRAMKRSVVFEDHTGPIVNVAFTPDGQYALSASTDKTLRFWKLPPSGATVEPQNDSVILKKDAPIANLSVAARSPYMVTGDGRSVQFWDVNEGVVIKELSKIPEGKPLNFRPVAIAPDGKSVLIGSDGGDFSLYRWEPLTGLIHNVALDSQLKLTRLAIAADAEVFAASHIKSNSVDVFRMPRPGENLGTAVRSATFEGFSFPVSISADGLRVLCVWNSVVGVWDTKAKAMILREVFDKQRKKTTRAILSPDGKSFLVSCEEPGFSVWRLDEKKEQRNFKAESLKPFAETLCLAYSNDGKRALSGSSDKMLRLWHVETGALLKEFKGHEGDVIHVAFTHDGQYAISGSKDKTVRKWKLP